MKPSGETRKPFFGQPVTRGRRKSLPYFIFLSLVARLKALADERRFKIIILVLLDYDLCVGALVRHLSISEAAVSQQLHL